MINNVVYSDQLYNWSVDHETKSHFILAQKAKSPRQKNLFYCPGYPQRFVDTTIQTMWKTRMQMHERTRPWTQILFVYQSNRPKSKSGLCTPKLQRTSTTIRGQLQTDSTNVKRNLRNKSRNLKTQRKTLENTDGYHSKPVFCYHRFRNGRNDPFQYVARFFSSKFAINYFKRGKQ